MIRREALCLKSRRVSIERIECQPQRLFTPENGVDATIVQTDLLVQGMIQSIQVIMNNA